MSDTNAEIQSKIDDMEKTYKQLETAVNESTGKKQDAAIRMLAGCGTALAALRRQLR
jgi:hypothetical protein